MTKIAVIGGSGLENPDILSSPEEKYSDTPYGKPSSPLLCGKMKILKSLFSRGMAMITQYLHHR